MSILTTGRSRERARSPSVIDACFGDAERPPPDARRPHPVRSAGDKNAYKNGLSIRRRPFRAGAGGATTVPGAKASFYQGIGHAPFWEDASRFKNRETQRVCEEYSASGEKRSLSIAGQGKELRSLCTRGRGESNRDGDIPRTHRLFNPGTCKVWLYRSDSNRRNRRSCHRVA